MVGRWAYCYRLHSANDRNLQGERNHQKGWDGKKRVRGDGNSFPLLTPMILELRDKFLVMGIHESQFFQMDLAEVERYAAAYQERQIIRRREIASYIHSTGRLIGIGVGAVQSSKIHYPSLYEAFPSLFEDENEQETMQQSVVNFMNFANAHNQKIRNKAIDGRKIKNKDYR